MVPHSAYLLASIVFCDERVVRGAGSGCEECAARRTGSASSSDENEYGSSLRPPSCGGEHLAFDLRMELMKSEWVHQLL